jgi:hypothetical protein
MCPTFSENDRTLIWNLVNDRPDVNPRIENLPVDELVSIWEDRENALLLASDAVFFAILFQCTQDGKSSGTYRGVDLTTILARARNVPQKVDAGASVYYFADGSITVQIPGDGHSLYYVYDTCEGYEAERRAGNIGNVIFGCAQ